MFNIDYYASLLKQSCKNLKFPTENTNTNMICCAGIFLRGFCRGGFCKDVTETNEIRFHFASFSISQHSFVSLATSPIIFDITFHLQTKYEDRSLPPLPLSADPTLLAPLKAPFSHLSSLFSIEGDTRIVM